MASPQSPTTGQPWVPVLQNKFTPGAEGLGGRYGKFGSAIAIDGNRALVGGEGMSGYGAVLVYEHDGDDWQHTGSLMPSERVLDEKFGHSVALSGDFAVIGVQPEDPTKPGFAYVFKHDGQSWHQHQVIKPTSDTNSSFGQSVSIDGFNLVVGAPENTENGVAKGSVHVFKKTLGQWTEVQQIVDQGGHPDDRFGHAVDVQNNQILVGAINAHYGNLKTGAVFVYQLTQGEWQYSQKLLPSELEDGAGFGGSLDQTNRWVLVGNHAENDDSQPRNAYFFENINGTWVSAQAVISSDWNTDQKFGLDVAVEGNWAVIGASKDYFDFGKAYLYRFNGVTWVEMSILQQPLPHEPDYYDRFSHAVELSAGRLLIGAPGLDLFFNGAGLATSYQWSNGTWEYAQHISAEVGATNNFAGASVQVDGQWAVVGAPGSSNEPGEFYPVKGAVDVYRNEGSGWEFFVRIDGDREGFGGSISLSNNQLAIGNSGLSYFPEVHVYQFNGQLWQHVTVLQGDVVDQPTFFGRAISMVDPFMVVAAPRESVHNFGDGAAYLFERMDDGTWLKVNKFNLPVAESRNNVEFANAVSFDGNQVLIGCARCFDANVLTTGAGFVFDFDGTQWHLTQKLTASDGTFGDNFGSSVKLQGNQALVGAEGADRFNSPNTYTGAAYVFDQSNGHWYETQKLTATSPSYFDRFGYAIGMDRNTLVVSGTQDFTSGYVNVYQFEGGNWIKKTQQKNPSADQYGVFGSAIDLADGRLLVGAKLEHNQGTYAGAAYVFQMSTDSIFCQDFDNHLVCGDRIFHNGFGD